MESLDNMRESMLGKHDVSWDKSLINFAGASRRNRSALKKKVRGTVLCSNFGFRDLRSKENRSFVRRHFKKEKFLQTFVFESIPQIAKTGVWVGINGGLKTENLHNELERSIFASLFLKRRHIQPRFWRNFVCISKIGQNRAWSVCVASFGGIT